MFFDWWGWRGSPLRLRSACVSRGAASRRRSPRRANRPPDALLIRLSSPFERMPNKKPPVKVVYFWLNLHEVIQSRESKRVGAKVPGWVQAEREQQHDTL